MTILRSKKWLTLLVIIVIGGSYFFINHLMTGSKPESLDGLSSSTSAETEDMSPSQTSSNSVLTSENTTSETPSSPPNEMKMMVDVKGAVKFPGVYTFSEGDRVTDVIERAGGFTPKADQNQVNLAEKLTDEMVIYIPKKGEEQNGTSSAPMTNASTTTSAQESSKIPINSATVEELEAIPGIGPTKAQAIVDYRTQNGPFHTAEDLLNVTGIGDKTLEKMKEIIVLK